MQLTQEFTLHLGNMQSAMKKLKAFRPPLWFMFLLIAFAFALGWKSGWSRASLEGSEMQAFSSGFVAAISAKDRADGSPFLTDRFYRNAVDHMVQQQVQLDKVAGLEALWHLVSPNPIYRGSTQSAVRAAVLLRAEERLSLAVAPTEQTKQALTKLNRSYILDEVTSSYINTAADYSALLGRQIRPEALVTDVQIQERISFVSKGYR
jgi:hypothetical protein